MATVGAKKTAYECGKPFYDYSGLRKHSKKGELTPTKFKKKAEDEKKTSAD